MKNCTTCGNAIFDTVFGEYKCGISKTYVRTPLNVRCENYKEGKPMDSKDMHEEDSY